MVDKLVGKIFRTADNAHTTHLAAKAKVLKKTPRTLLKLAKTVLAAHDTGNDVDIAIEKEIGWKALSETVLAAENAIQSTRDPYNISSLRAQCIKRGLRVTINYC